MTDWELIKTEYVTSDKTYGALAKKYAVPYSTLRSHGRMDRWVEKREEFKRKTMEKALDHMADRQSQELQRVEQLADQLLEKLQTAVDQLELIVVAKKEKGATEDVQWENSYEETAPGGMVDRQGLKQLASALKDLKAIKDLQSALETQEQKARIQKLQKDGRDPSAEAVIVKLEGELSDYGQ